MTTRRLAAILAADVVGFSRLMGQDEEGTLARIKQLRRDLIEPKVQEHGGRVFKTTGDGFWAEFPSPMEAVPRKPSQPRSRRSPPAPFSFASASTWAMSSSRRMVMFTGMGST
jgi:class 3 adenylate cyclase